MLGGGTRVSAGELDEAVEHVRTGDLVYNHENGRWPRRPVTWIPCATTKEFRAALVKHPSIFAQRTAAPLSVPAFRATDGTLGGLTARISLVYSVYPGDLTCHSGGGQGTRYESASRKCCIAWRRAKIEKCSGGRRLEAAIDQCIVISGTRPSITQCCAF